MNIAQSLTYIKILANDDGNGVVGFDVVSVNITVQNLLERYMSWLWRFGVELLSNHKSFYNFPVSFFRHILSFLNIFSQVNGLSVHEPRTAGGVGEQLPIRRSVAAFGLISVQWRVSK